MLILTLRTDRPEAELALFQDEQQIDHVAWLAHRELAENIHHKIKDLLTPHGKQIRDVKGLVVYKGPGSFTGLRIGISVANALADSLGAKIVGTSSHGHEWQLVGVRQLLRGTDEKQVTPDYGADANVTLPGQHSS